MPIGDRRYCPRVVQHDLGLTRHVGRRSREVCLEVEGVVRGTFLVRSWASLTPACGIGKVSAALDRASYTLGPPALGAGFCFRTFDSFFSRAGVWLTFPLRLPALARQHLVLLALECAGTASVQVGDRAHIHVSI